VVIPMSGVGARFQQAGYRQPKPLIDVAGKPMITRILENFPKDWRFVFICNEEHLRTTKIREVLLQSVPDAKIVSIAPHKRGPVHTVWEGREGIDDALPALVNYCDFSFAWAPQHFLRFIAETKCDGAIFSYRGFHPHYFSNTLYAYSRIENGQVAEIKEKGHFTPDRTQEFASSGSYFFGSGALVKQYFKRALDEGLETNGEYYVSLVYNPMIHDGRKVLIYEIPFMLQWGTPQDLEDYVYWHRAFESLAAWKEPSRQGGARLLMPMAGLGSRFKEHAGLPKPLIPVNGVPMYQLAKRFLPVGEQPPVLVLRREIEDVVRRSDSKAKHVVLEKPTDGQAITTQLGLEPFSDDEPVIVSACDHGLLWDDAKWRALVSREPDVIVVGQRGYPGARRTPKSFAYLDVAADGKIHHTSVKLPLSDTPQKDLVLVGTFYFKSARLLRDLIDELRKRDLRVNGELYLDSSVNLAVERGLDVRCFESDAYLNWGSPETLSEFTYWQRYFQGAAS
jgi:NDP-sugar pyrophosphorylase family protein